MVVVLELLVVLGLVVRGEVVLVLVDLLRVVLRVVGVGELVVSGELVVVELVELVELLLVAVVGDDPLLVVHVEAHHGDERVGDLRQNVRRWDGNEGIRRRRDGAAEPALGRVERVVGVVYFDFV